MGVYDPKQLGVKSPTGGFQTGGWYNGRQYWNGTLSDVNTIHPESNQPGAGGQVNAAVVAASNPAQNKAPGTNEAYLAAEAAKAAKNKVQPVNGGGATTPVADIPMGTAGNASFGSAKPTIDLQGVYNSAYKTPEIDAANKAVSDAQVEIDKATAARDAELAIINDNPLYSAARMIGKQDKLDKKYSNDINRLQNAKALAQDALAKQKADAEIKVNIATKQYDIDNQAYKDSLSLFNNLLSAGGLLNASGTEIASYATQLGIPTSMISSIIQKQKSDEIKPSVTTATDDSGNVTVTAIDSKTGDVLYKTSLGKIDKATKGTSSETKATYYNYAKADARSGMNFETFYQIYSGYLTPNEMYATFNGSSQSKINDSTGWSTQRLKELGINPNLNSADALAAMLTGGQ